MLRWYLSQATLRLNESRHCNAVKADFLIVVNNQTLPANRWCDADKDAPHTICNY